MIRGEPRSLLVRGVNWLGDAVMTLPAMRRLRERFPRTSITLLTPLKLADLWLEHSDVDAVVTFAEGESPWVIARRLRASQFDTALIWPNSPRSAIETWLARVPNRVGYAGSWRLWALTQPVRLPNNYTRLRKRSVAEIKRLVLAGESSGVDHLSAEAHQIHHYLQLASVLGCETSPLAPKLEMRQEEVDSLVVAFPELCARAKHGDGTHSAVRIGLNVSAAYGPAKRWPIDRFAAVVQQVSASIKTAVWLNLGSASDWTLGEQLKKAAGGRVLNLAGKTSLRQLMALLRVCDVVLTNDSGPMHLAAALGTRVIVPFGSTSPELTGPGLPGNERHRILRALVPCSPCFRRTCPIDFRCMAGISVEAVVTAVQDMVG
jgi:heptosyltransferase II